VIAIEIKSNQINQSINQSIMPDIVISGTIESDSFLGKVVKKVEHNLNVKKIITATAYETDKSGAIPLLEEGHITSTTIKGNNTIVVEGYANPGASVSYEVRVTYTDE